MRSTGLQLSHDLLGLRYSLGYSVRNSNVAIHIACPPSYKYTCDTELIFNICEPRLPLASSVTWQRWMGCHQQPLIKDCIVHDAG